MIWAHAKDGELCKINYFKIENILGLWTDGHKSSFIRIGFSEEEHNERYLPMRKIVTGLATLTVKRDPRTDDCQNASN